MKLQRPALIIAAAFLVGIFAYLLIDRKQVEEDKRLQPAEASAVQIEPSEAQVDPSLPEQPDPDDFRLNRKPDGRVEYLLALETSRTINQSPDPLENLVAVSDLFRHYRFAYQENPVGVENFEITEQLLGKNPKKIIFIAADSPALRGNELIDEWGTPFFFHSLSAEEMEVRSAGPDRKHWTEDDILSN